MLARSGGIAACFLRLVSQSYARLLLASWSLVTERCSHFPKLKTYN